MFSIVIPLYNKESTILRTLNSVLEQTFSQYEVLVIDDGSEDQGPSKVSAINDPRVRLVKQKNQGPSAARNSGIKHAVFPYVAFLDGDDIWENDYLQTITDLIEDFPEASVFATHYHLVGQRGNRIGKPSSATRGHLDFFRQTAETGQSILHTSSVVVRKKTLEAIGGFNEDLRMGEDLELWCRLALDNIIAFDPRPKSTYYFETPGNAMSKTRRKSLRGLSPSIDFLLDAKTRGGIPPSRQNSVSLYMGAKLMAAAKSNLVKGDPLATLEYLRLAGTMPRTGRIIDRLVLYLGCYIPVPLMRRFLGLWTNRRAIFGSQA